MKQFSIGFDFRMIASADNTNLGLDNSHYHAQPHPIIVNYPLLGTRDVNIYIIKQT